MSEIGGIRFVIGACQSYEEKFSYRYECDIEMELQITIVNNNKLLQRFSFFFFKTKAMFKIENSFVYVLRSGIGVHVDWKDI